MGLKDCSDKRPCELHELWKAARDPVIARMKTLTLKELAASHDFSAQHCRSIHKGASSEKSEQSCGCKPAG